MPNTTQSRRSCIVDLETCREIKVNPKISERTVNEIILVLCVTTIRAIERFSRSVGAAPSLNGAPKPTIPCSSVLVVNRGGAMVAVWKFPSFPRFYSTWKAG